MKLRFDPEARHEVEESDAVFARAEGRELQARIYRPRGVGPGLAPCVVDVHGGAWSHFDRTAGAHYGRALAASGATVVALDFRQGPSHHYPAACADVAAGLRWVRAHARALGIDPACVGLCGSSSGGQTALEVALRSRAPELAGTPIVRADGSLDESEDASPGDTPAAFVLALFPVSDPLARYRYAQSRRHEPRGRYFSAEGLIRAQEGYFQTEQSMAAASIPRLLRAGEAKALPPIWVAQPELDENVPLAITDTLVRAYRDAGGSIECVVFPGERHGFVHRDGPGTRDCLDRMRRFIAAHLPDP